MFSLQRNVIHMAYFEKNAKTVNYLSENAKITNDYFKKALRFH